MAKTMIDAEIPAILILGRSGVGKSTFIHQLGAVDVVTGLPPAIGHELRSGSLAYKITLAAFLPLMAVLLRALHI